MDAATERCDTTEQQTAVKQQLSETMSWLANNYSTQQKALLAKILPDDAAGGSQAAKYNPEGLLQFLEQLSDFDVAMNQVVVDKGILQGEPSRLQCLWLVVACCLQCTPAVAPAQVAYQSCNWTAAGASSRSASVPV